MADLKLLQTPVKFHNSGLVAPNPIVKSAMTERICDWSDDLYTRGQPNELYNNLYRRWGEESGLGIIILGNVPIDSKHPEARANPIVDYKASWDHVAAFTPAIQGAKRGGALVLIQLAHAGRQTPESLNPHPLSSGDIQCPVRGSISYAKPTPMTKDDIKDLVKRFAYAAQVFYKAGADGIQYHAAHGYLLSQFLSPLANNRTDEYGGTWENRTRILRDIVKGVRDAVPDTKFMLSIKINSADFVEGGFSEKDSERTVFLLEELGVDLIELSGGTYESLNKAGFDGLAKSDSTAKREAFFLEFADRIRPHLKTSKLCVTGGFRSTEGMASALRARSTDLIGVGRPLASEVDFAQAIVSGKREKAKPNRVPLNLQTPSSVKQLHQIAANQAVSDFENEAVAQAFVTEHSAGRRSRPRL